jgi:dUTP pyrophosphatase
MEIEMAMATQQELNREAVIKFKRLDKTVYLPKYQSDGAVGLDLQASEDTVVSPHNRQMVSTGLAVEIPIGFEGQIRPRSGLASKNGVSVINSPGTIDPDYRGEIKVCLVNHDNIANFVVKTGDRIAQLVICPVIKPTIVEVEELSNSQRGENGFGSTGK